MVHLHPVSVPSSIGRGNYSAIPNYDLEAVRVFVLFHLSLHHLLAGQFHAPT